MMRQALVTGGSGGIGRAVALKLAAEEMRVWVHYHRGRDRAQDIVDTIVDAGGEAALIGFDITDWQRSEAALNALIADIGAIDVLVHNAGITEDIPFPGMEKWQWDDVINTSLNGFFHVTRPLVMPMIRKRWGRIVSVASLAALHGNRGQANYAAAKAGIIGASRSLAKEVATRGICVNVVAPGFIQTPMIDDIPVELIKQSVPMKRVGKPEEVAEVIGFLCSAGASYVTGEVINVSGGVI